MLLLNPKNNSNIVSMNIDDSCELLGNFLSNFIRQAITCQILLASVLLAGTVSADDFVPPKVVTILTGLPVSQAQKTPQQNPIDNFDGEVYIANIEPGPNGDTNDINLHTVIRKGVKNDNGEWTWTKHLVEERTIADTWHTVPSIGVDKRGYVHIAYNMHNMPWQYKVSSSPADITSFEFKGQEITKEQIADVKFNNQADFPTLGEAAIPGNQITYPTFFKDNSAELYLSYRYAAKPAKKFADREMSSGIARYNTVEQTWKNIGVQPVLSKDDYEINLTKDTETPEIPAAFSMAAGWTSYHPRLTFGPNNILNINWMWRKGIAGSELSRPCYLTSSDQINFFDSKGKNVNLPVKPSDCANISGANNSEEFYGVGNSTINAKGELHMILSPIDKSRQLVSLKEGKWRWEESPYGATEIFFDNQDNLWALASGLSILVRKAGTQHWLKVLIDEDRDECRPKASLNAEKTKAYIYSPNCRNNTVSVKLLDLKLD